LCSIRARPATDRLARTEAAYDARTRRLSKTEKAGWDAPGETTLYRYDGGTNVQELRDVDAAHEAVDYAVALELARAGGLGGGIGGVL